MAGKSGDQRIETLRGLAVLAVVAHHATIWLGQSLDSAGLPSSVIRDWAGNQSGLLQALRMPLFTVLSGWVYALKPFRPDAGVVFLSGKLRRILIPLFFVASAKYFLDLAIDGDYPVRGGSSPVPVPPDEFWMLWFYRYGHLWFLHALLVIFGIIAVIDGAGWMRTVRQWLLWVALAALLPYVARLDTAIWSLHKLLDILVFFLVGVGINRFSFLWSSRSVVKWAWAVLLVAMGIHVKWKLSGESFDPWPHFVAVGSLAPICLLSLEVVLRPLVWIGGYSYTIYLYHGFGFALLIPLQSLLYTVHGQFWWFIGLIVAGVCLPIVIDRVAGGIPYVRTLMLGRSNGKSSHKIRPAASQ